MERRGHRSRDRGGGLRAEPAGLREQHGRVRGVAVRLASRRDDPPARATRARRLRPLEAGGGADRPRGARGRPDLGGRGPATDDVRERRPSARAAARTDPVAWVVPLVGGGVTKIALVPRTRWRKGSSARPRSEGAGGHVYHLTNDFDLTVADLVGYAALGLGRRVRTPHVPVGSPAWRTSTAEAALIARRPARDLTRPQVRGVLALVTRDNPFSSARAQREARLSPPAMPPRAGVPGEPFAGGATIELVPERARVARTHPFRNGGWTLDRTDPGPYLSDLSLTSCNKTRCQETPCRGWCLCRPSGKGDGVIELLLGARDVPASSWWTLRRRLKARIPSRATRMEKLSCSPAGLPAAAPWPAARPKL